MIIYSAGGFMPDIIMCEDKSCPMNGKCYRYLAIPSKYRQSYFIESPRQDERCEYFQEIQKGQPISQSISI